MMDTETALNGHRLLDVIRIIAFHGESGRLQMTVGSTRGAFFFTNGRLVDASIGSLTGFQAVNAAVSMGEAHFSFEPSIPPPALSSITSNERTILKQFFGIETADPECNHPGAITEPICDITPTQVVPLSDVEVSELEVSENDPGNFATVEMQPADTEIRDLMNEGTPWLEDNAERATNEPEKSVVAPVFTGLLSVGSRHRSVLYLTLVFVLMAVGAVALVQKWSKRDTQSTAMPSASAEVRPTAVATLSESTVAKSTEPPATKKSGSSAPVPEQQGKQIEQASSLAENLTGEWTVVNVVEKTSYRSFKNLEIGFRLAINQTGRSFTAKGEKVSENGRSLPASGRTPIHVTGSINGDKVEATFLEEGALRKTNGRFVWRIEKTGSGLAGTFVSSAARTSGKSAATRQL